MFWALAYACAAYAETGDVTAQVPTGLIPELSRIISTQDVPSNVEDDLTAKGPAFPLKTSVNKRYLIDKNEKPFLIVGDAPQNLIGNLSPAEADAYMANRQRYGINTLWVNLLCIYSDGCNKDATTFDGVAPFTVAGDLSTPNPAYFQRVNEMLNIAAAHGMLVLLDPIETISWLGTLRANGVAKAYAYGQYLGSRYKNVPNIIWLHGNDFQSWSDSTDDPLVQAVALGIKSADTNHPHTVELNYYTSGSLDDASWAPLIELDAAYTYFPTYAQVLTEYNRSDFKPVFMIEGFYEFENVPVGPSSTSNLRRQEYWSMLSGACGHVYGSGYTWRLNKGWEDKLDTPGAIQLSYMKALFLPRRWYDLIPDQSHTLVTAGYDGFSGFIGKYTAYFEQGTGLISRVARRILRTSGLTTIQSNSYLTAARTSDGTLAIAYIPSTRTIMVDMARMTGGALARWYDPTNGTFVNASDTPLPNSGERRFEPPGKNSEGDGDWVFVLEVPRGQ